MLQSYRIPQRKQSTTVSSLLPLTVILLLFCLVAAKSEQSDCVEVICPLEEGGTALRLVDNADLGDGKKCEHCEQCTRNGYSVCVQPVQLNSSAPNPPTLSGCECAHSGPNVRLEDAKVAKSSAHKSSAAAAVFECRLPVSKSRPKSGLRPNLGEGLFRLCFSSSAIRKMSKPEAKSNVEYGMGKPSDLLVTIEQFWLSDYWKALKPAGLHLFYVFPVAKEANCEGKSKEEVAKLNSFWLCKTFLEIHMDGEETANIGGALEGLPEGLPEAEDDYAGEEEDTPPEVLFERNVFAGAEKVRLFYEVTVHRENQLKLMSAGKVKFESRKSQVQSDPLDFELNVEQPNKHHKMNGSTEQRAASLAAGTGGRHNPPRVDRVGIEQRKTTIERMSSTSQAFLRESTGEEPPTLLLDASTAVPAPRGSVPTFRSPSTEHQSRSPSLPSLLPTSSYSTSREFGDEEKRLNPIEPEQREHAREEEEWQLLRNVLLISLLSIAVLFGFALCYKKRLCCCGRSSQGERNGKTRSINGKEYRETGQRLALICHISNAQESGEHIIRKASFYEQRPPLR
uniref:TNFR-Cys domain-containing protein n=1 Tax=Globodera pallida TaxID=36090 RepID=A0A183C2E7_GLOPA